MINFANRFLEKIILYLNGLNCEFILGLHNEESKKIFEAATDKIEKRTKKFRTILCDSTLGIIILPNMLTMTFLHFKRGIREDEYAVPLDL